MATKPAAKAAPAKKSASTAIVPWQEEMRAAAQRGAKAEKPVGGFASIGIGGGILKVPALTTWCGVPMRVAATTSSLMIGVTAAASAPLYYAAGDIPAHYAAASVLGVMVGTRAGFWVGARLTAQWLKLLLGLVLVFVATMMLVRA